MSVIKKAIMKYPTAKAAHSFMVNKAAKAQAVLWKLARATNTANNMAAMMVGSFISDPVLGSAIATVTTL
jgi:hypothetical protein